MAIYKITADTMVSLTETQFGTEKILERQHLQRMLRTQIQALAPDLMVIAEIGDWAESSRRIDLLCIDSDANLVVVEIKRTDDGGHMDLQAIRYASMISTMRFEPTRCRTRKVSSRSRQGSSGCTKQHFGVSPLGRTAS